MNVPSVEHPETTDGARKRIFRILETVVLTEDSYLLARFQCTRKDASEHVKRGRIGCRVVLRRVNNHRRLDRTIEAKSRMRSSPPTFGLQLFISVTMSSCKLPVYKCSILLLALTIGDGIC